MIMNTNSILVFIVIAIVIIFIIYQNNNTKDSIENFQNQIKSVINPTKHDYKDSNNENIVSIFNVINNNNSSTINNLLSFKEAKLTNGKKYLGHQISKEHPEYSSNSYNHFLYKPSETNQNYQYYQKEPTNLKEVYNFREYDNTLDTTINTVNNSNNNNNNNNSPKINFNFANKTEINDLITYDKDSIKDKNNYIKSDDKGRNFFDFGKVKAELINKFNSKIDLLIDNNLVIELKDHYNSKNKTLKTFTISSQNLRDYFKNKINIKGQLEDFIKKEKNLTTINLSANNFNDVRLYYTQGNFNKKLSYVLNNLQLKLDSIHKIIKETTLFTEDGEYPNFSLRTNNDYYKIYNIKKSANIGLDILDTTNPISNAHDWGDLLENIKENRNNVRSKYLSNIDWSKFYIRLDNTDNTNGQYIIDKYLHRNGGVNLNNATSFFWKSRSKDNKRRTIRQIEQNPLGFKDLDIYFHSPQDISNELKGFITDISNDYKNMDAYFMNNKILNKMQLKHGSNTMTKLSTIKMDEKAYFTSSAPSYTIFKPTPPTGFVCVGDVIVKNSNTGDTNSSEISKLKKKIMCIPRSCYLEVRSWKEKDRVATIFNVVSKDPVNINAVNFYVNPFTNTFRTTIEELNGTIPPKRLLPSGKVGRIAKCPDVRKFDDVISLVEKHKTIVSNCKAEKEVDNSLPIKSNKFDAMEQSDYLNRIYQQEQRIKALQKTANKMLLQEQNAEVSKREKNRQDLQSHIEKQREVIEKGLMKLKETQNQVEVNISYPMRVVKKVVEIVAESNQPIEKKIEVIKKLKEITDTPDYKEKIDRVLQSCPELNMNNYLKREVIPCYGCDYS